MSAVKGTHYTLYEAGTLLDPGEWAGKVLVSYDKYEAAGLASGSTIHMGLLPAGARVLPISMIVNDALGTDTTLAVGDGTTADKFLSATSTAAAGQIPFDGIDALGEPLSEQVPIVVTVGGGAATGTIKVWVFYTLSG